MTNYLVLILALASSFLSAQDLNLENQWYNLGPIEEPSPESAASSKGIGPVEFIRTTELQKGLILAGSLNGGLFYTVDGGESWLNAGSDYWPYSAVTWADFYPKDKNIWFASSHERESNGRPGRLAKYGGVYRTKDSGITWELIANKNSFNSLDGIAIYKMVFDPKDSKRLYIITSADIYYTNDCLADIVIWKHETRISGSIYDLEFVSNHMIVASQQKGKWHLYDNYEPIKSIDNLNEPIERITVTSDHAEKPKLYILIDYKSGADKLYGYDLSRNALLELSRSQRVTFGAGRTFAVNPHAHNEIYLGVSTRLRRWNINTKKFENLGSDYHVDVEFVTFDPFDTNKIYMASHGGVFISNNKGESWENKSNGIGIAEVLGMDVGVSDPNEIVIGTFHDGSMVYADWEKNGRYFWKNVNGGDALIPLINPNNSGEIYTSNQYNGGGIYHSSDSAKNNLNLITLNDFKTSGWSMAACLHSKESDYLFFNFKRRPKEVKDNIDIARTNQFDVENSAKIISNFKVSHSLNKYSVFSLFNSKYHPDLLLAYVLHYDIDEEGKAFTKHKLFRTLISLDTNRNKVIGSWHELEVPRNAWIADVVVDKKNKNKMYFSYVGGSDYSSEYPNESGMIYYAKYKKRNNAIKRNFDISLNMASGRGGKYNLVYTNESKKYLFIGTQEGIFIGTNFTMKGGGKWRKVGYGLPHCMVYGLHYDGDAQLLTVGLKGRGVWRISLTE